MGILPKKQLLIAVLYQSSDYSHIFSPELSNTFDRRQGTVIICQPRFRLKYLQRTCKGFSCIQAYIFFHRNSRLVMSTRNPKETVMDSFRGSHWQQRQDQAYPPEKVTQFSFVLLEYIALLSVKHFSEQYGVRSRRIVPHRQCRWQHCEASRTGGTNCDKAQGYEGYWGWSQHSFFERG